MSVNSKLIFLEDLKELDYSKLGLKCGIETHQQLNCGKLFSPRPANIVPNEDLNKEVKRYLRFSLSETGESDSAAEEEFKKQKYNIYKYNDEIASLVDLDEEPPCGPNERAFETVIQIGEMLNLKFFDSIQFMRKLIIDGSVTSGFQRTAMIGIGGSIETNFGYVGINGINIEEDSCRPIERHNTHNIFSLDRQGIPLIEITTSPDAKTPQQVYDLAYKIGSVLRSFSTTRRGLGTIRQDLNISIKDGARIEIKGAQNLKLIKEVVDSEIKRQEIMLSIKDELENRGVFSEDIVNTEIVDLTGEFQDCESKVISNNLDDENCGVYGIKLKGFKDILGHELHEGYRFGSEISQRNKSHFPKIKGLFHGDELPKYGIDEKHVQRVKERLGVSENDNFIFVVFEKNYAIESLENIKSIISHLMQGVPSEVRQVDPKGTLTKYLRPMPGSARMYPETDIPTINLEQDYLDELNNDLPEMFDEKLNRLKNKFGLDENKTLELIDEYDENQISKLIEVSNKKAQELYSILFDIPKDIKKREGLEPISFKQSLLEDLLDLTNKEGFSQGTIRDIFLSLYKDKIDEVTNLKKYIEDKGLLVEQMDDDELEKIVKGVIDENQEAPFGALMGNCMKKVNGRADGKRISQMLKSLMNK